MNHKSSYFRKLVLSLILTAFLPLAMGTALFYNYSLGNLRGNIRARNQAVLDQTADSLAVALESVMEVSKLLLLDSSFKTYSLMNDKNFFDQYRGSPGDLSGDRRATYNRYLELRTRISSKLDLIPVLNEFIRSVYFFDESTAVLFKSGVLPETITDRSEIQWFYERLHPERKINEARILLTGSYEKEEEIVIVYRNILEDLTFFVSIDTRRLYQTIRSENSLYSDALRFVLSREHLPILYESRSEPEVYAFIRSIREKQNLESSRFEMGGRRYFANKTDIQTVGWSLYSFIDARTYRSDFMLLRIMVFSIFFTFVLLITASAVLYLKMFYSPFEKMIRSIQSDLKIKRNSGDSDFTYIRHCLEQVTRENNYLESRLSEALPSLKKDFLRDLLMANDYSLEEISERFELLEINLALENIQALIILIDDNSYQNLDFKHQLLLRISIKEILTKSLKPGRSGELLELESHKYLYLINTDRQRESGIRTMAENAIASIKETLNCESNIAIGSPGRSIYDLSASYREADELLNYLMVFGKGSSITREDIEFERDSIRETENSLEKKTASIIQHLGNREIRKAQQAAAQFCDILFDPDHKYADKTVEQKKVELLNKMLIAIDGLQISQDEYLKSSQRLYLTLHELESKKDTSDFYREILGRVDSLGDSLGNSKTGSETNSYVQTIFTILEKDYGETMNLNQLSEQLKLNPSYVSRLFKEATGISFTNYLTNLRMEKAKHSLRSTDKAIREICKEVGYWNTNYFIKVFKKSVGATPGEFRKKLLLENKQDSQGPGDAPQDDATFIT